MNGMHVHVIVNIVNIGDYCEYSDGEGRSWSRVCIGCFLCSRLFPSPVSGPSYGLATAI